MQPRIAMTAVWLSVAGMLSLVVAEHAAATTGCAYEHPYIGNHPKEDNPGWHENTQGITHDDDFWYVTQTGRLWKIPATHDLREPPPGTVFFFGQVDCSRVPCRELHDTELGDEGFNHLGDLTHYEGHLCVAVEYEDKARDAVLASFRASDLTLEGHAPLPDQNGTAGWCAVDPGGFAYSSDVTVTELSRYSVNWDSIEEGMRVTRVGTVALRDETGAPLSLFVMQGGVFSDDGLLYLVNGNQERDCEADGIACGVHVFEVTLEGADRPCASGPGDCVARRVDRSTNGSLPFNYEYHPEESPKSRDEEPEGITYWDLTAPGAAAVPGTTVCSEGARTCGLPVASSQLHVLMLDNDGFNNADDIYVKHYRTEINCDAVLRVVPDELDFGEVGVGAVSRRSVTVSNPGGDVLVLSRIEISVDAGSADFSLAEIPELPWTLHPSESVRIVVEFAPQAEDLVVARLEIESDAPEKTLAVVNLSGAGRSFVMQGADLISGFDDSAERGELRGSGPGMGGARRQRALRNMLVEAVEHLGSDRVDEACEQLADALARTDGETPPPDFVEGEGAERLAEAIRTLMSNLACEVPAAGSVDERGK